MEYGELSKIVSAVVWQPPPVKPILPTCRDHPNNIPFSSMHTRFTRLYPGVLGIVSAASLLTAAGAVWKTETMDTLTVHQIRVVDNDGTLRLLIANQEHFPSQGLIRGKPLTPGSRSVGSAASLFFYNRDGSEQGALRWDGRTGHAPDVAHPYQYAALTLDQLEANDNLVLSYGEQDGHRGAAVSGFEQPQATPLDTLLMTYDTVGRSLPDTTARAHVREAFRRSHFLGHQRFSLGYSQRDSHLILGDALGRPRLRLFVDTAGVPRIQLLDTTGTVVREITGTSSN